MLVGLIHLSLCLLNGFLLVDELRYVGVLCKLLKQAGSGAYDLLFSLSLLVTLD